MALARAQIVIPYDTGLPEDVITNSLYFEGTAALTDLEAQADATTPGIIAFYEDCYAGTTVAANYVNWGGATVRWYDMAEPEPRVPYILPAPIDVGGGSASTMPSEVSIVASFHAAAVPGSNPRRRRGRIYLGGWAAPAASPSASYPPVVLSTVVTNITNAMETLQGSTAAIDSVWSVYSPTSSTVGPLFVPVAGGWVDNTFDTQRRRGVAATSRTLWP